MPRKWQIFDIMHQEQMIMVRLQGQPFQYEEGCPIPVIHNDQSFILEPLLLKFFFAFLSIFFCISAGTTLCICGSSLVHQYLSIPCTKNNDNKDKKYLAPRIMIIKIKKIQDHNSNEVWINMETPSGHGTGHLVNTKVDGLINASPQQKQPEQQVAK